MNETHARLFFAITFDDALKEAIAKFIAPLKTDLHSYHLRWVNPEKFHITLHFIEMVNRSEIPMLLQHVQEKVRNVSSFTLDFARLMLFPPQHPHMIALQVKFSSSLFKLAMGIAEVSRELGYSQDEKVYIPHLTLAKFTTRSGPTLQSRLPFSSFEVNEIVLLESVPVEEGTEYSVVEYLKLRKM